MRVIDADALLSAFESEEDPKESLWTIYGIKRKIEDAPDIHVIPVSIYDEIIAELNEMATYETVNTIIDVIGILYKYKDKKWC